jgi:hypothetical protein
MNNSNTPSNPDATTRDSTTSSATALASGKPRKSRKWLWWGGGFVVVLGGVVAFAPQIASAMAPGIIKSQSAKYVKGTVSVRDVRLSWGGPQRIDGVSIVDAAGTTIATTSVETTAGLLGLARGNLDLGEVTIRETKATLVRHADGELNVQKMLVKQPAATGPAGPAKSSGPQPAKPLQLPAGLKVKLTIENLAVQLEDQSAGDASKPVRVELKNVRGDVAIDPQAPLAIKLSADASETGGASGSVSADIKATDWANAQGVVTLDRAALDAKIDVAKLPTSLVDALAGPVVKDKDGRAVALSRVLGDVIDLRVDGKGTLRDATAKIGLNMQRLTFGGELRIAENVLTSVDTLSLQVQGAALASAVPALQAAMQDGAQTKLDGAPDVAMQISNVRLALPQDGKPMSLVGASADASIATTQVTGLVTLQQGQPAQRMMISPMRVNVATKDVAQGVRMTGGGDATLGGNPAGRATVDATLAGLLDERGAFKSGMPGAIDATLHVSQVATAIAQPFVAAWGLDLPRDVGATLDVEAKAKTGAVGEPMAIDFALQSQHVQARGALAYASTLLATREGGIVIDAAYGGRIAQAMTRGGAWRVSADAGPVKLNVLHLRLPLDERGARIDRAGVQANAQLSGVRVQKYEGDIVSAPIDIKSFSGAVLLDNGKVTIATQGQGTFDRRECRRDWPGVARCGCCRAAARGRRRDRWLAHVAHVAVCCASERGRAGRGETAAHSGG